MQALILVDIQHDFLTGGALAVPDAEAVIDPIVALAAQVPLVVATQDRHPAGHESFASSHPGRAPFDTIDLHGLEQTLWPDHCVEGTHGAALHPVLHDLGVARVFPKGTNPRVDSYSGFFDNGRRGDTGLHDFLRGKGVDEVHVVGLATDYCVKFTALDAARLGYATHVHRRACRAVNLRPGDDETAYADMAAAGVVVC